MRVGHEFSKRVEDSSQITPIPEIERAIRGVVGETIPGMRKHKKMPRHYVAAFKVTIG